MCPSLPVFSCNAAQTFQMTVCFSSNLYDWQHPCRTTGIMNDVVLIMKIHQGKGTHTSTTYVCERSAKNSVIQLYQYKDTTPEVDLSN